MINQRPPYKVIFSMIAICVAWHVDAQSINNAARQSQLDVVRQQQLLQQQQQQSQTNMLDKSDFNFKIQRTERSPVKKGIDDLEFLINSVEVEGQSAFNKVDTDAFFTKYIGKKSTLAEINEGVEELENQYRKEGYFLSKVYIPAQKIDSGILKVSVIEGYINKVNVEGGSTAMQEIVKERMQKIIDKKPLDLHTVESELLVLNAFPGYTVTTVLRQGTELGASEIFVKISAVDNLYTASVSNFNNGPTGPWSLVLNGTINRVGGRDNQVTLNLTNSIGMDSLSDFKKITTVSAKYAEPIGHSGLVGSVTVLQSVSKPLGSLESLSLDTNLQTFSPRLTYPLYRGHGNAVSLDNGVTLSRMTTLSSNALLNFDKEMVYDINFNWINNIFLGGFNTFNMGFYKGLPGGNSLDPTSTTASTVGFNPLFTKVSYNWMRIQPITRTVSLQVTSNGQYTNDNLLSSDQLVFGGQVIGRGYDSATIAGDKGAGIGIELRKDTPYKTPYLESPVQLFTFWDYGTVTVNNNVTSGVAEHSSALRSYGFGIRTNYPKGTLELQYAVSDINIASSDPRPNPRVLFYWNYFF